MDEKEIVIVSAFFNFGRGESTYQRRTCEDYIEYFKFWARIKNTLYIYTSSEFSGHIMEIRKRFGLEEKTNVIVIDDIWAVRNDYLEQMKAIEQKGLFSCWRYKQKDMSNIAEYDYIMLMKYYCLAETAKQLGQSTQLCWLDFGWNHGGETYTRPEEFDFEWKFAFPDKINLFSLSNPYNLDGIVALQKMTDSIMGCNLLLNSNYAEKLYRYCCEALESLLSIDIFDDDQMLLRMACNRHREDFSVVESDWFLIMKEYGGEHLSVRPRTRGQLRKQRSLGRKLVSKKNLKFLRRIIDIIAD